MRGLQAGNKNSQVILKNLSNAMAKDPLHTDVESSLI